MPLEVLGDDALHVRVAFTLRARQRGLPVAILHVVVTEVRMAEHLIASPYGCGADKVF